MKKFLTGCVLFLNITVMIMDKFYSVTNFITHNQMEVISIEPSHTTLLMRAGNGFENKIGLTGGLSFN